VPAGEVPPTFRHDATIGLLSLASGGTDALSFLALGVFTSAMSGNATLLGIALGQHRLSDAARSVIAFAGYAAGVAFASALPPALANSRSRVVLLAEMALLAGFAALWPMQVHTLGSPPGLSPNSLPVLTALASAAMGMQAQAARGLRAQGIPTVVFTSTLTDIVGALTGIVLGRGKRRIEPRTWRQICAFGLYIAGAAAQGALALYYLPLAPVPAFACVLLACVLA
jgi:uncharacterized membrane protein YoaK (UPF0700 family)